ncbi:MAG: heat-inducible transcription repressor HrcA [Calditrichaeota bacterium]|nr:heat-inducible transcription repressor HrcA [Calditrichota bacterium]MCB9367043.1 heat-inducible transcription repressor HrcA [Calditrichota bacterium]MCB9391473.1 heat-inducible transcription repressor HrcA [Calditrichota bacterium]
MTIHSSLPSLTERERLILRAVVQHFILTATPVGSRHIARKFGIDLSAATIRNVMSDLEEMGLLSHPHTSAGRMPSDLGYRLYVDDIMELADLSGAEREDIEREIEGVPAELESVLDVTTRVLSTASHLLGVVVIPELQSAVLQRIELARLSERRLLVVITLHSGPMKSIMLELEQEMSETSVHEVAAALNRRLAGLTVGQIREQIAARMQNLDKTPQSLIRLFVESTDELFNFSTTESVKIGGRAQVISQPEFSTAGSMRGIIELVEDKDIIVHLLQNPELRGPISITIGRENTDSRAKELSVIAADYKTASSAGKLGVIGPTRMDYSRLTTLLEYTAHVVTKRLS